MRQAVTTLSMWGERHFGYTTLRDSTETLGDERWPQIPRLKEDSVIEEKEVEEDSGLEQTPTSEEHDAVVGLASVLPMDSPHGGEQDHDLRRQLEAQPKVCKLPFVAKSEKEPGMDGRGGVGGGGGGGGGGEGAANCVATPSPDNDHPAGILDEAATPPSDSLGEVAPVWVPDSQAPACMKCGAKFTFTKRRHHCRACGKVFCVVCCDQRCRLTHLDGKEGRVCVSCHFTLMNRSAPKDQRRVWFADGLLPDSDARDSTGTLDHRPSNSSQPRRPSVLGTGGEVVDADAPSGWGMGALVGSPIGSSSNLIPSEGLPPILTSTGVKGDYTVEERPSEMSLMVELEGGRAEPLVFVLNANLLAMVKLINYVNRRCWCVMTKGMHAVGQAEVVVLLQCLPDEKTFPRDIFTHFIQLYRDALAGKVLNHLSHSTVSRGLLGSKEHAGFLYIRPTFQSLDGLPLPSQPFLFGILILRAETPWAKAFPLRLMLRLGAEYRFYPCPLFSVRFRKALFGETSHTIMRLLVDFRFYRYTLPVVTGLMVDMEARSTCIKIPKARHSELLKALNKSNEHVLAMGACFNENADSHLICVQSENGQYQTQAISIHNKPRRVTGACFFVFSGALKISSGYLAKSSIVEDGLMVQITMESMVELRRSLREMKDFTVTCGKLDQSDNQECVYIQWLDQEPRFNKGISSPIDGKSMESITSIKMFQKSEYRANGKVIRWTEVFFLQRDKQANGPANPTSYSRLTERLARAFCLALCSYLKLLKEDGMAKLGLRVTLDTQRTDYLAGSNGQALPSQYMKILDSALMPVIQAGALQRGEGPLEMEFIFYIQENIS
ncbi:zinc finger FYVE domain-containing protein 9 isoform X1 [Clupea harengus]|uniref:Zinc finger FYVE domain-containing protein 9 isoform X1 n=1 Tax=Clupea harengus TaxID=7950 RepID=A0A6P3VP11_CLUHA|nr:zinc finger FYVE domain-containing protein 9 isoform X1 [Clupea harengus]XP_031430325.1 zinc finger FYVE domain-containing protein 9 isoform X1 [Clupea harengus]